MCRRYKSSPPPQPDAHGYVEQMIAGRCYEVSWSLTGDRLQIVAMSGSMHSATRDTGKGSVEDQARGMIIELWEKLRSQGRVAVVGKLQAGGVVAMMERPAER